MFVAVLLNGFKGDGITKGSCYICRPPRSWCQCGICEDHGILLARAGHGQATGSDSAEWQGTSFACYLRATECESKQRQILQFLGR